MGETNSSSTNNLNPYKDPLFIAVNESAATPLGSILFDGKNFLNWSRSIRIALGAKNKLGFLEGKHPKPSEGPDEIQKWTRCDYMVRSWLLATMKPEVASSLVTMQSTKRLWEEIVERHGQTSAPLLFQLKKDMWELQQGYLSVSEYYCKLKDFWDQISEIEDIPECSCGALAKCSCSIVKKMIERESSTKLMKFLMGLNSDYEQMKTNFLGMDPLMPVNKVYNLVMQVEKQKQITGEISIGSQTSALAANRQGESLGPLMNFNKREYKKMRLEKIERDAKKCQHCGMKGHLREECFKLVGYPDWFKNNPKGKGNTRQAANATRSEEEYSGDNPLEFGNAGGNAMKHDDKFISSVVQEVMKAIGEKQNATASSHNNFAGKEILSNAVNHYDDSYCNTWLIDSGASDHMTGNKSVLTNMRTLDKQIRVGLPDGNVKTVKEIGDVKLNDNVTLFDVLYVSDFKHNLLSVSKLVHKDDLKLLFDKHGCSLQGLSTEDNVVFGENESDLYKLINFEN
ncbi:uncharacterized protein [Spinacia oleracea]|uniref:CCHC-type domain-containing protein n=1 Tax=Spinacia oleracea TaxID=3562 RepID=A0ABM3RRT7_SPIOL|nr:uncharacterized protein LOC130471973 [Spinacia oleracea]